MKRLAINFHEGKYARNPDRHKAKENKIRQGKDLKLDKENKSCPKHNQKLPHRDWSENLILVIDELRNNEFIRHGD